MRPIGGYGGWWKEWQGPWSRGRRSVRKPRRVGFNPPQIDTNQRVLYRHQVGGCPTASPFLLLRQKKVTKEKATPIFALILRCSQRAGPAQIARWRANRAQWAHGAGLRPRVAPLLGVEYTGTPFGRNLDRFAMGVTACSVVDGANGEQLHKFQRRPPIPQESRATRPSTASATLNSPGRLPFAARN